MGRKTLYNKGLEFSICLFAHTANESGSRIGLACVVFIVGMAFEKKPGQGEALGNLGHAHRGLSGFQHEGWQVKELVLIGFSSAF